jgi:prepilin-type N-terminal cleavage/methylation domain-containing protein
LRQQERRTAPRGGFTVFELIVVLTIMGVLLAIGVPRVEGLVPKYRLRSAARSLASTLEYVRVSAINRERWMGIRYVFEPAGAGELPYYQVIPPAPEDNPYQPIEDRELQSKKYLPTGVRFHHLVLAGNQMVNGGAINVLFSPGGNAGSHAIVLEGQDGRLASLKLNCITGIMQFSDTGQVAFENFEE